MRGNVTEFQPKEKNELEILETRGYNSRFENKIQKVKI